METKLQSVEKLIRENFDGVDELEISDVYYDRHGFARASAGWRMDGPEDKMLYCEANFRVEGDAVLDGEVSVRESANFWQSSRSRISCLFDDGNLKQALCEAAEKASESYLITENKEDYTFEKPDARMKKLANIITESKLTNIDSGDLDRVMNETHLFFKKTNLSEGKIQYDVLGGVYQGGLTAIVENRKITTTSRYGVAVYNTIEEFRQELESLRYQ